MKKYIPLVCYQLPLKKQEILSKITEIEGYQICESFSLPYVYHHKKKVFFFHLDFEQILVLNQNEIPFILFTDIQNERYDFKQQMFRNHIPNIVFLHEPSSWILPYFYIEKQNKLAILIENHTIKYIYKKLLEFAGFSSLILTDLDSILYQIENQSFHFEEVLILINMDIELDILKLFYNLKKIFEKSHSFIGRIKLILMKDLERPFSIPILTLKQFLNQHGIAFPRVKRFFSPMEVISLLIESQFFYNKNNSDVLFPQFLSLEDFLYSSGPQLLLKQIPHDFYGTHIWKSMKKGISLLWLYELARSQISSPHITI